ncbi:TPA: hypothetical protein MI948_28940, partial [Klebsiella pneumoniae]|nr:hypothetical protein [Klebsiella pneumoniae]
MSGFRQKMSPESISGTGQPGGLWRDIPGRRGLNGERRTEHQGRHPGNDGARRAKRRCPLQPGGRFPGCEKRRPRRVKGRRILT